MSTTGSLDIDSHLLRVPFEALKRAAKERKNIVDSAQQATTAVLSPGSAAPAAADAGDGDDETPEPSTAAAAATGAEGHQPITRETTIAGLDALLSKLHGLKRKLVGCQVQGLRVCTGMMGCACSRLLTSLC